MKSPDNIFPTFKYLRMSVLLIICSLLTVPLSWSQTSTSSNGSRSISITETNNRHEITIKKDGTTFNVEINGFITLADDDRDIVAISGGGFLKISKSAFGSKRKIVIEADRSGQLIRKYYVGWREQDYEPEGRNWLAEVLPEIVRSSGVGAEDRVNRIYEQGGMTAMANEIRLLDGDYVKTLYLKLVMCKKLSDSELTQLVNLMGEEVESDHYLAELLMENHNLFTNSPSRLDAYVRACRKIDSDHYLTEVLMKAVQSSEVSDQQLSDLLKAAEGIQSDHYLSSLLVEILEARNIDGSNMEVLLQIGNQIQSDHYQTEVLRRALNSSDLSDAAFNRLLDNIGGIQSDHYVTEVITELWENDNISDVVTIKLLEVVQREVSSDHYQSECLQAFLENHPLTDANTTALIEAVGTVSSDNYATNVMQAVADVDNISDSQLIALLQACGRINSDHYLAESLGYFASEVNRRGSDVKSAYSAAAKNISSESYYGRALRAIE